MSNLKKPKEPKHRETFTYKGLTYKYDKYYGEWHLRDESKLESFRALSFPTTIFYGMLGGVWTAGNSRGATPQAALKKWEKLQLGFVKVRVREAKMALKENDSVKKLLMSKRWKK